MILRKEIPHHYFSPYFLTYCGFSTCYLEKNIFLKELEKILFTQVKYNLLFVNLMHSYLVVNFKSVKSQLEKSGDFIFGFPSPRRVDLHSSFSLHSNGD